MKNFKKLLLCLLSITSTISLIAENKQQIRLSNLYGQEVLVHMNWRYGTFSQSNDVIIKPNQKNLLIKAPISGYKLFSIDVTPSINLATLSLGAVPGSIAYGVTHSMNHHTIRHHGNTFFVIEKEKKNSKIASQKQINIKGYKNQAEYEKAIEVENINKISEISAAA